VSAMDKQTDRQMDCSIHTWYFSWHRRSLDRGDSVAVCREHTSYTASCPRECSECRSTPKQTQHVITSAAAAVEVLS